MVKSSGKWRAALYHNGKDHTLGSFGCEEEAARAYDAEATRVGRLSQLNFPPERSTLPRKQVALKRSDIGTVSTQVVDIDEAKNIVYRDSQDADEQVNCVICMCPPDDGVTTPCEHIFCRSCISYWLSTIDVGVNRSCPVCRVGL
eukprot:SAG31_NODE_13071_length_895_cov_0.655779_1_plen_144_part_10